MSNISGIDAAADFYTRVLGAERLDLEYGRVGLRLAGHQINLHGPGSSPNPLPANVPGPPGQRGLRSSAMLHDQLAWYIAGPALGLCVVAYRWLFNARLGVTGGFSELIAKLRVGSVRFDWRGWFAIGIFIGGALFALIAGGPSFHGYGWLTDAFGNGNRVWIVVILFVAGVLTGFGTRLAGGCTSGNGLSGTSALSPASLAATATFFGTAIVVTFVTKALT